MSNTQAFSNVTLRSWTSSTNEALNGADIAKQLSQLVRERGPLRGITESSLQQEIDGGQNEGHRVAQSIEEGQQGYELSTKEEIARVQAVKREMFQKVEMAHFTAANTLDLVALILSKNPAHNVESAYSQLFQSIQVPRGSFGLDKTSLTIAQTGQELHQLEQTQKRRELVMMGSRMEIFDWATDNLLKAAQDLETEIHKENKYWEEVLSISEKGWPLQRTRTRDARRAPMAVRYGYSEASSHFKNRGLAPLRMSKDGSIVLDPSLALQPKTLRVRISDNGITTGTSHLSIQNDPSLLGIEQSIQFARESLFEEELFYEMTVESRQLKGYDVKIRDSVLHVALPVPTSSGHHRKILVDCVARQDDLFSKSHGTQAWLAQCVAEGLRLLLSHEHRMRLHRRSCLPSPLTLQRHQQQSHSNPPLLRSLLSVFSHFEATEVLQKFLRRTAKTLKSAGFNVSLQMSSETSLAISTDLISGPPKKTLSAIDRLLNIFARPLHGTATLSLTSAPDTKPSTVIINTRTFFSQPQFGTEHRIEPSSSIAQLLYPVADQPFHFKSTSTAETISHLDWILSLDLAHRLQKEYSTRSAVSSHRPRVSITTKGTGRNKVKEADVLLELRNGILKVTWTANIHALTSPATEAQEWNGASGQPSFSQKVKDWVG